MLRSLQAFEIGFAIAALACARLAAQETNYIPTLSIEPFSGDKDTIQYWKPSMGQGLSEMLTESLEGLNNKFQVVESTGATELQMGSTTNAPASNGGKTKSNKSGSASSPKTGNGVETNSENAGTEGSAGSDFTLYAEVTQFVVKTNSIRIPGLYPSISLPNIGAKTITAQVAIEWRVEYTETKKVIATKNTESSAFGTGFDISALVTAGNQTTESATAAALEKPVTSENTNLGKVYGYFSNFNVAHNTPTNAQSGGGAKGNGKKTSTPAKQGKTSPDAGGNGAEGDSETYSYGNPEFIDSAMGKASTKAVTNIIEQLAAIKWPRTRHTPGKILAVADNSTIIVSLGSNQGFKEGDQLDLYETTDIKDDKGNVVFTVEKQVGELTMTEVQDDKSCCSYSGDAKVQQGWIVKAK